MDKQERLELIKFCLGVRDKLNLIDKHLKFEEHKINVLINDLVSQEQKELNGVLKNGGL